jgi:hypothetical protein
LEIPDTNPGLEENGGLYITDGTIPVVVRVEVLDIEC